MKGLWCSVPAANDRELIVCESAIDALSLAALRGHHQARCISLSGALSTEQKALLGQAVGKAPAEASVVAAFDNDEAGDGYLAMFREAFDAASRDDLEFIEMRPSWRGADWNDVLRSDRREDGLEL